MAHSLDDSPVRFEAFPPEAYEEIDLTGLAAYALQKLDGLHVPTSFENMVVTLFKLFPAKFSLVGFTEYPDAARVGRTLLQLGPKYRNWARGSVQKGFVLTSDGSDKAASVGNMLAGDGASQQRATVGRKSPRTMDLSKDIAAVESSNLYQRWKDDPLYPGDIMDLLDLLGAYAYTPKRALRERLSLLEKVARQLGREDIKIFIDAMRKTFRDALRE